MQNCKYWLIIFVLEYSFAKPSSKVVTLEIVLLTTRAFIPGNKTKTENRFRRIIIPGTRKPVPGLYYFESGNNKMHSREMYKKNFWRIIQNL